ncbi:hypothetical protein [Streptomyces sp. NPDC090025]|uniref:hypothetical protein n=1 Tax=Streptomyces sp. NPDC090025 TaxID=3365922 RepID=UPI003836F1E1
MSAHTIPASSLLTAFAATCALAWACAGRRRGPVVMATGLAAVQGALHLILGAGEHGPHGAAAATPGEAMAAMPEAASLADMAAMAPAEHLAYMSHLAHLSQSAHGAGAGSVAGSGGSGPGMLAAHLLAALVCGLWLARGEAALFTLARTVGARARTPLRLLLAAVRVLVPALPPRRPVRPGRPHRRPHGVVLAHTVSRRGPPRPAAPRATALGIRTV